MDPSYFASCVSDACGGEDLKTSHDEEFREHHNSVKVNVIEPIPEEQVSATSPEDFDKFWFGGQIVPLSTEQFDIEDLTSVIDIRPIAILPIPDDQGQIPGLRQFRFDIRLGNLKFLLKLLYQH